MDSPRYARLMLILGILVVLLGLSGCQVTASKTTGPNLNDIVWLQKSGNLSVNFNAMMTFKVDADPCGKTFTGATRLGVPSVPITWMGTIFNGTITDSGTGYSLTDQVHGNVSSDGEWINEMTFSRRILNQLGGSNFSVTLTNVPIVKVDNASTTVTASFEKKGIDIRKYITLIDYSSGGSIGTAYDSTDWDDANGILGLGLDFATGAGTRPTSGPSFSGGGM
jgi:hypothetical protein